MSNVKPQTTRHFCGGRMDASNLIVLAVRSPLGGIAGFIENIAEYLDQAERRNRVLRILWFLCTVAVVVVTAILSGLLYWLLGWKAASFAGVTLWAIYLGATGLLVLPPKAMTAVFGTMLGISLSEVSSGAGLIAAAHKAVAALSTQIGAIVTPTGQADPFLSVLIWTFVLVLLLLSLPAFFAGESKSEQPRAASQPP